MHTVTTKRQTRSHCGCLLIFVESFRFPPVVQQSLLRRLLSHFATLDTDMTIVSMITIWFFV